MEVDDTNQLLAGQIHGGGSDLDFAFQLQLQEAIRASLTSKSSSTSSSDEVYSVYFKGLVSNEIVSSVKMSFVGIGISIRDSIGGCLVESGKSFLLEAGCRGSEGDLAELEALIESLNVAVNFGLKRVHIFCDSNTVYQFLTAERQPTNKKIGTLVDRMNLTRVKFAYFAPFHVKKNDMKFVYKLARDAIISKTTNWNESEHDSDVTITEQCTICFGCFLHDQMFSVNKCLHRYCFSCMKKHIEAKLLQGKLPKCPHEKCASNIAIESCKKLLNRQSYLIMRSRVKEASIPPADKVYCPFSNCSALMSQTEVNEYTPTSSSSSAAVRNAGMRKCVECDRLFCINCKVPWHDNITCSGYMQSSLFKSSNDAKLKSLATKKHWRECIKCKNLVELARGCNHIYCRCGHEFCYKCGAEWVKKTPTCKCPIWDERNIVYGQPQRQR